MSLHDSPSGSPVTVVATDIADGSVTNPKLADGSVDGNKIAAQGVGSANIAIGAVTSQLLATESVTASKPAGGVFMKSVEYPKESTGVLQLLAQAGFDRAVIITVRVPETFANLAGAQPTFQIGETATPNKFADTGRFTDEASTDFLATFSGILLAGQALIVTAVPATLDATGSIMATATAFRNVPA